MRESVGVTEVSNFAKYEVTGAGAEAWLAWMMTNVMPKYGPPMLNERGKLIGDFTIAKAAEKRFQFGGHRRRRFTIYGGLNSICRAMAWCKSSCFA